MFIIALLAAGLHLGWIAVLWNAPGPMIATPISPYYLLFDSSRAVAIMLLLVTGLALTAKWYSPRGGRLFFCLVPQQVTVMASAMAAIHAIATGHYADGIPRPWEFIFADQWGVVVVAILHTAYVVWIFATAFGSPAVLPNGVHVHVRATDAERPPPKQPSRTRHHKRAGD